MYNVLVIYGQMNEEMKKSLKEDYKQYCQQIKNKEVTYYFTDMINICLKYQFTPPDFIFCMAKAFICLNGINKFTNNKINTVGLLQEQIVEYLIKRSLKDCKSIIVNSLRVSPKLFENTLNYGIIKTIAKEYTTINSLIDEAKMSIENLKEILQLLNMSSDEEIKHQKSL